MREHGLLSRRRSKNPYKNIPKTSGEVEIADNILDRKYTYTTLRPFRVFGVDITFIRIEGGRWAYLDAIKDFCTGEIVAYEISLHPNTELVLATLTIFAAHVPLEARLGGLMHTDRGSVYTSKDRSRDRTSAWPYRLHVPQGELYRQRADRIVLRSHEG